MINIVSTLQLVRSFQLSQKTNTEGQLIERLLYLDNLFDREKVIVDIYADIPFSESSIIWRAYYAENGAKTTDTPFYVGGLIYHHIPKKWEIHS